MAKRTITINDGSKQREQVELNLNPVALTPTVRSGGQYNVVVQQTPKTNSALQLAQALRATPQILGQAKNVAMDMGEKAALQVDDVEEAMLDDETKGILGYDKAYQQALVKRHFVMNEAAIRERFDNVAGRATLPTGTGEQDRLASINEFVAALDAERDNFNAELMEQFGGNANREQALQALSSTFVDGLHNEAMETYTNNLKSQTEMLISADTQTMIEKQGVKGAFEYARNQYKALGVPPKVQAQNLRNSLESAVGLNISQGNLRKASAILAEAESYKITGNASLLGTTEGKDLKARLLKEIQTKQNAIDIDADEVADDYAAIVADSYAGLRGISVIDDINDTQRKVMMNAIELVTPNKTQEERQELFDSVFTGNGTPIQNFAGMLREQAVNGGDAVYDMYNDSRSKLDYLLQNIGNRPLSPFSLTTRRKEKALDEFKQWQTNNPQSDYKDWIKETGQPFNKFDELVELSNELTKGNYVRETLGFKKLGRDLKGVADAISDSNEYSSSEVALNETVLTGIQSNIENQLVSYAQTVADEENSLELVEAKRKQLLSDAEGRLKGLATAMDITIDPLSPSVQADLDKTSSVGGAGRGRIRYRSLDQKTIYSRGKKKRIVEVMEQIEEDRKEMIKNNHLPQLTLSLTRFGFSTYSKENVAIMNSTGVLDAGDVNLGFGTPNNLGLAVERFLEVIKADTGLNKLTEEQKTIREEYQALGIYDENTLEEFLRVQTSFLNE